jgi:hypothetical protein
MILPDSISLSSSFKMVLLSMPKVAMQVNLTQ